MDKKLKVSIIIPVHNQFDLLNMCLNSIYEKTDQNIYDYEIILSDSNSDPYLKEFYSMLSYTANYSLENKIRVIQDDKNPGFSRAINSGMKIAQDSDYYVWLNSDTLVSRNWLNGIEDQDLCSPISNNASYQTMLPIDINEISLVEKFFEDELYNVSKYEDIIKNIQTPLLNGFCYIISQAVFKTIGMLDEIHFPHYGSEDDYSLRAYLKGFKAYILMHNFVFHKGNQSYKEKPNSLKKQQAKNLLNKYPNDWFDKLVQTHKFKTRNARQQLTERFIEYVQKT